MWLFMERIDIYDGRYDIRSKTEINEQLHLDVGVCHDPLSDTITQAGERDDIKVFTVNVVNGGGYLNKYGT